MKTICTLLLGTSIVTPSDFPLADPTRPKPTIEVGIVWTDVRHGMTDIFLLLTNPNDFDVYVGECGSSETVRENSVAFGCGAVCSRPEDFSLLPARARRLSQFHLGCGLVPGPNRFHIELTSAMEGDHPWNYVVRGNRVFDFVIVNPDTLDN